MADKKTYSSPYLHAVNPQQMGENPFAQHELVLDGVVKFLDDPFERSEDLRGAVFEVCVHRNGLHVTVQRLQ